MKLGDSFFVAVAPAEQGSDDHSNVPFPMIAAHAMGRTWTETNFVHIRLLDESWTREQIGAVTLKLSYAEAGGFLVLTASTEELRRFALDHSEGKTSFFNRL